LISQAAAAGAHLYFDAEETRKHGLQAGPGITVDASSDQPVQLCVAFGGDGTILRALRRFGSNQVPVFGVNFGVIGFLASIEPEALTDGIARALRGDYELLRLPAIVLDGPGTAGQRAINDVAVHRRAGDRVAELSYAINGEILGSVRCDGLVIATPAGSTGYNLANGGPVMAWGVEGFVVSFIAPHSLTARALVVAPADRVRVVNRSVDPLAVSVDGRPACMISAGGWIETGFVRDAGIIAQLPGTSFYLRLREKFGRLAR
jgi:NAD+ kinase